MKLYSQLLQRFYIIKLNFLFKSSKTKSPQKMLFLYCTSCHIWQLPKNIIIFNERLRLTVKIYELKANFDAHQRTI